MLNRAAAGGEQRSIDLEALIRADYERARPGDSWDDLKRRARFSRRDKGLLRHWLEVAQRRAAAKASP